MKPHLWTSILFAALFTVQTINPNIKSRMNLMIPVMVLFFSTFLLFAVDYEKIRRAAWARKEKKLIESTYERFYMLYLKKKESEEDISERIDKEKKMWLESKIKLY